MKRLLVLLALMTGCGGQMIVFDCDLFEAGGITICATKPVDSSELAELVQVTEEETAVRYPEVIDLANVLHHEGVSATFLNAEVLAEGCRPTRWDDIYVCEKDDLGLNRNGNEIILLWQQCLAKSALAHETLHAIQAFILHSTVEERTNHTTPWMFESNATTQEEYMQTIEWRIYARLWNSLDSCASERPIP